MSCKGSDVICCICGMCEAFVCAFVSVSYLFLCPIVFAFVDSFVRL